ncbi:MAG: hypothetical protein RJQ14_18645 [Marinoscillum sp.]
MNWEKILIKIMELSAMTYKVDGFFAVSPKINISNIHHHLVNDLPNKVNFPIKHWTPETCIKEYFALDTEIYKHIYGEDPPTIDSDRTKDKLKTLINNVLDHKDSLSFTGTIEIKAADREPSENDQLKTTLDRKLNSILAEDDPDRIFYHQQRCNYKVYLEELQDLNNNLRAQIMEWQDNMRSKAIRLTKKFQDQPDYSPMKFFNEFFEIAEIDLIRFMSDFKLRGGEQKLLNGVVFELAAECKLNWASKTVVS